MRSEKLLQKWYIEARKELMSIGFPYIDIPIKLNGRLTKTYGWSIYGKRIEINKDYFLYSNNEEHIKDTIMHELCHELALKSDGHSGSWLDIVNYVNRNLGYNIEEYGESDWYEKFCPKYVRFRCVKCGYVHGYEKISGKRNVEYKEKNHRCLKCKGRIKLYKGGD